MDPCASTIVLFFSLHSPYSSDFFISDSYCSLCLLKIRDDSTKIYRNISEKHLLRKSLYCETRIDNESEVLHSEFQQRLESHPCFAEGLTVARSEQYRLNTNEGVPSTPNLGRYSARPLPSPDSSSNSPPGDKPQGPKVPTLPSFRELDAFPAYLPSPVSGISVVYSADCSADMSRPSDPGFSQTYQTSMPQDKVIQPLPSEQMLYPYNNRYIQGEPNYQNPWQSNYFRTTPPVVTNISPHEIHTGPYSAGGRPTLMMGRRKASRGDPEYVKRPRRKAEEVERLYSCNFPGCDKAYGALNHLNTHVRNAEHGPKREPKGMTFFMSC